MKNVISYLKDLLVPDGFLTSPSRFLRNQLLHFGIVGFIGTNVLSLVLPSSWALGVFLVLYIVWEGFQLFGEKNGEWWDSTLDVAFAHAGAFAALPTVLNPFAMLLWVTLLHAASGYLFRKGI